MNPETGDEAVTVHSVLRLAPYCLTDGGNRLQLSGRGIKSIGGVPARACCAAVVFLASNHLDNLNGIGQFYAVRSLSLQGNPLADWKQLFHLSSCSRIEHVSLGGTPLASRPFYRARTLTLWRMHLRIPHLQSLDGERVRPGDWAVAQLAVEAHSRSLAVLLGAECRILQFALLARLLPVHRELLSLRLGISCDATSFHARRAGQLPRVNRALSLLQRGAPLPAPSRKLASEPASSSELGGSGAMPSSPLRLDVLLSHWSLMASLPENARLQLCQVLEGRAVQFYRPPSDTTTPRAPSAGDSSKRGASGHAMAAKKAAAEPDVSPSFLATNDAWHAAFARLGALQTRVLSELLLLVQQQVQLTADMFAGVAAGIAAGSAERTDFARSMASEVDASTAAERSRAAEASKVQRDLHDAIDALRQVAAMGLCGPPAAATGKGGAIIRGASKPSGHGHIASAAAAVTSRRGALSPPRAAAAAAAAAAGRRASISASASPMPRARSGGPSAPASASSSRASSASRKERGASTGARMAEVGISSRDRADSKKTVPAAAAASVPPLPASLPASRASSIGSRSRPASPHISSAIRAAGAGSTVGVGVAGTHNDASGYAARHAAAAEAMRTSHGRGAGGSYSADAYDDALGSDAAAGGAGVSVAAAPRREVTFDPYGTPGGPSFEPTSKSGTGAAAVAARHHDDAYGTPGGASRQMVDAYGTPGGAPKPVPAPARVGDGPSRADPYGTPGGPDRTSVPGLGAAPQVAAPMDLTQAQRFTSLAAAGASVRRSPGTSSAVEGREGRGASSKSSGSSEFAMLEASSLHETLGYPISSAFHDADAASVGVAHAPRLDVSTSVATVANGGGGAGGGTGWPVRTMHPVPLSNTSSAAATGRVYRGTFAGVDDVYIEPAVETDALAAASRIGWSVAEVSEAMALAGTTSLLAASVPQTQAARALDATSAPKLTSASHGITGGDGGAVTGPVSAAAALTAASSTAVAGAAPLTSLHSSASVDSSLLSAAATAAPAGSAIGALQSRSALVADSVSRSEGALLRHKLQARAAAAQHAQVDVASSGGAAAPVSQRTGTDASAADVQQGTGGDTAGAVESALSGSQPAAANSGLAHSLPHSPAARPVLVVSTAHVPLSSVAGVTGVTGVSGVGVVPPPVPPLSFGSDLQQLTLTPSGSDSSGPLTGRRLAALIRDMATPTVTPSNATTESPAATSRSCKPSGQPAPEVAAAGAPASDTRPAKQLHEAPTTGAVVGTSAAFAAHQQTAFSELRATLQATRPLSRLQEERNVSTVALTPRARSAAPTHETMMQVPRSGSSPASAGSGEVAAAGHRDRHRLKLQDPLLPPAAASLLESVLEAVGVGAGPARARVAGAPGGAASRADAVPGVGDREDTYDDGEDGAASTSSLGSDSESSGSLSSGAVSGVVGDAGAQRERLGSSSRYAFDTRRHRDANDNGDGDGAAHEVDEVDEVDRLAADVSRDLELADLTGQARARAVLLSRRAASLAMWLRLHRKRAVMGQWLLLLARRRALDRAEAAADAHHAAVVRRRCLAHMARLGRTIMAGQVVQAACATRTARRAFGLWLSGARCSLLDRCLSHARQQSLLAAPFAAWRAAAAGRHAAAEAAQRQAEGHHEMTLKRKAVLALQQYSNQQRRLRAAAAALCTGIAARTRRMLLRTWRTHTRTAACDRSLVALARTHCKQRRLLRAFWAWEALRAAAAASRKRNTDAAWLAAAQLVGRCRRSLSVWRSKASAAAALQNKEHAVAAAIRRRCMKAALRAWKQAQAAQARERRAGAGKHLTKTPHLPFSQPWRGAGPAPAATARRPLPAVPVPAGASLAVARRVAEASHATASASATPSSCVTARPSDASTAPAAAAGAALVGTVNIGSPTVASHSVPLAAAAKPHHPDGTTLQQWYLAWRRRTTAAAANAAFPAAEATARAAAAGGSLQVPAWTAHQPVRHHDSATGTAASRLPWPGRRGGSTIAAGGEPGATDSAAIEPVPKPRRPGGLAALHASVSNANVGILMGAPGSPQAALGHLASSAAHLRLGEGLGVASESAGAPSWARPGVLFAAVPPPAKVGALLSAIATAAAPRPERGSAPATSPRPFGKPRGRSVACSASAGDPPTALQSTREGSHRPASTTGRGSGVPSKPATSR